MNEYRNIQASLLKFASDFATEMALRGYTLQVVNLDAFTDASQFPQADFVGIGHLQVQLEPPFVMGQAAIAISTRGDTNLFRMAELINEVANRVAPLESIPVVDAVTGERISQLSILNGTRVATPMVTETQPMQPVFFSFQTD